MSVSDSLHIEKRKFIRYEKHITIVVQKFEDEPIHVYKNKNKESNIVPIKRDEFTEKRCFNAELIEISAGGLSIYSFEELDPEATYFSILFLPDGNEIELYYRVVHVNKLEGFEEEPGAVYGCKFVGLPPAMLKDLYFDDLFESDDEPDPDL